MFLKLIKTLGSYGKGENRAWGVSYKISALAKPSWAKHGLPYLFDEFVSLVKRSRLGGLHLDVGCGNGVKTVMFGVNGLLTTGIDRSDEGFEEARGFARELDVENLCRFIKASCIKIPLKNGSVGSVSDILMFTHLRLNYHKRYEQELNRLVVEGGYLLLVLFSDKDEHFHGHPVSKSYHFIHDPNNPRMQGYEHYQNMFNIHFGRDEIKKLFSSNFKLVKAVEVKHPLYPQRKLWNLILRKPFKNGQGKTI